MPFDADIIEILKQNREIDKKLLLEQEKLRLEIERSRRELEEQKELLRKEREQLKTEHMAFALSRARSMAQTLESSSNLK